MNETKQLTCINCPLGCLLTVELEDGKPVNVTGNTCPRGVTYANKELTNPTRIVTSTVKVEGGKQPVVAVKTRTDVPKNTIFTCMEAINAVVAKAPVHIGDVLLADICGTGVELIATQNCEEA